MPDFLLVLALAAVPALANLVGGLLAEVRTFSDEQLSYALHAAAGIVLAVVAVELLPHAAEATEPWLVVLAFVLGGLFFVALDRLIELVRARSGGAAAAGPWAIFFGVALDLFSDGLMIGAGTTVSVGLGVLLALGQAPADLPEGFATIATFKRYGVKRVRRLLLAASFSIPILLGATIGYLGLRDASPTAQLSVLAFTAGILVTVVVEEMVPEAHRGAACGTDARLATVFFIAGFGLFTLLASYLG